MKFIWIMGPSAAGKEYHARQITSDTAHPARVLLGINSDEVTFSEPSLVTDTVQEKLRPEDLLEDLAAFDGPEKALLVKWQLVDSGAHIPEALRKRRPDDEHIVMFLFSDMNTLTKNDATRNHRFLSSPEEIQACLRCVRELKDQDFPVTWIDTRNNEFIKTTESQLGI